MTNGEAEADVALDRYELLIERFPQLIFGREMRPVVTVRRVLQEYVATHGTLLGVIAQTPHFYVLVDLVMRETNGCTRMFPYSRIVQRKQLEGAQGVAILALVADERFGNIGDIVVVKQERHATGRLGYEIPRGFGEQDEGPADAALRELAEETGFIGDAPRVLGVVEPDNGLQDGSVIVYRSTIVGRRPPRIEFQEAISETTLMPPARLFAMAKEGLIRDAFTICALQLAYA